MKETKKKNFIICVVLVLVLSLLSVSCGKKQDKHSLVEVAAVAATCTADGNVRYYKCSDCDKLFADSEGKNEITSSVIIKATGHKLSYTDGIAANCETNGYLAHYICEKCDLTFSDQRGEHELEETEIAPIGHVLKKVSAVEADCVTMSNGNVEYYVCGHNCSKKFVQVTENTPNSKLIATESGENIFVVEKKADELIVFAEHNYQGNICANCKHVQNSASGGLVYELSEDGTYYVLSGMGSCRDKTIFVSGEYKGKPVKEVKAEAFKDVTDIKAIVFIAGETEEAYVERIGENAFENCTSLRNVYFAGGSNGKAELYGILSIGANAFKGCTELTVTYEGSCQEWARIQIDADLSVVNVVFKSLEIVVPFSV